MLLFVYERLVALVLLVADACVGIDFVLRDGQHHLVVGAVVGATHAQVVGLENGGAEPTVRQLARRH